MSRQPPTLRSGGGAVPNISSAPPVLQGVGSLNPTTILPSTGQTTTMLGTGIGLRLPESYRNAVYPTTLPPNIPTPQQNRRDYGWPEDRYTPILGVGLRLRQYDGIYPPGPQPAVSYIPRPPSHHPNSLCIVRLSTDASYMARPPNP
jgi:hypothetical protein